MRVDPESVYLEPTGVFAIDRASGRLDTGRGVSIHWKEGARWQSILLMPDDGETFGGLLHRLGDWMDAEPDTWTSELLHGSGTSRSGDSERVRS